VSNSRTHRRTLTRVRRIIEAAQAHPARLVATGDGQEVWTRGSVVAGIPIVDDDAPPVVQEGFARRKLAALTGRCPCGARPGQTYVDDDGIAHLVYLHDADCPATTENLEVAIAAWRGGAA
jgi:hypothetical protein